MGDANGCRLFEGIRHLKHGRVDLTGPMRTGRAARVRAGFGRAALAPRWNGVGGRFGVTRLTKFLFTSDKKALLASYHRVLDRDFDRVVVSHGAVLEGGGHQQLAKSVTDLFGAPHTR